MSKFSRPEIPFLRPEFSKNSVQDCLNSLASGWLAYGHYTDVAEKKLAAFFGASDFIMTSSCTASLQLALMLEGVGPGDEVITTPLSWVATSNVVLYQGATIKFADVEPETGLVSIDNILNATSRRTKAVIAVDLYGAMFDYAALREKLPDEVVIIEDAAHSFGSRLRGLSPGAVADYCCFSFHAAKNITAGQGGGLICREQIKASQARLLRRDGVSGHDASRKMYALGQKFDGTDFQSALLIDQIDNYEKRNNDRVAVYERYEQLFSHNDNIRFQKKSQIMQHSGHMFVLWLENARRRDGLAKYLHQHGVRSSVHYNPIHLEPFYMKELGFREGDMPISEKIGGGAISLPTYPSLCEDDQIYISDLVSRYFNEASDEY